MDASQSLSITDFNKKFPTVFDGKVRNKEFHIPLTKDTKLFCVNTTCSIPFALSGKLKAELEFLQAQNITAPVTEVTEWSVTLHPLL